MSIVLMDSRDKVELQESIQTVSDRVNELSGSSPIEPAQYDLPRVYINGAIPETKTEVLAQLTYISKTHSFDSYITIKCQGTSSLSYPKKNFTVKLYQDEDRSIKLKKNFKGWGNQNKFCLKANWMDISHARNVVSAKLWADVVKTRSDYNSLPEELRTSPNQGAVDGFPVKVYCNGIYWGRYTWNIPKDGWMCNMDDSLETHCILGSEDYVSGCFRANAVIDESDWADELHEEVPDSIVTSFNNAINFVMNSTDDEFVANIENYFNLSSLIDYYCFSYAACHLDGLGKNQLFFTYDGIHWIASAYDLDSTWGLYWNGESFVSNEYRMQEDYEVGVHNTTNLLYERLEALFVERIKERWIELRNGALSIVNINNRFEQFGDICPPYIVSEDYAVTTGNGSFTGIPSANSNNIRQICNYAVKRLKYVDSQISPINYTETIIRENYSPNGAEWVDTETINFANGDYIEVSIDLSGCVNTNENILSVGDDISVWSAPIGVYHLYYTRSTGTLEVNSVLGGGIARDNIAITDNVVVIKVNSDGLYVNGNLKVSNGGVTNVTNIEIGSAEGVTRSNATYNYVKVVKS